MKNRKSKLNFFVNRISEFDEVTVPDLAITPAQMLAMAEKGIPIANHHLNQLYTDGEVNPSWEIDMDRQRGTDVVQLWEHNKTVKEKIKKAYKESITNNKDKNG